MRWFFAVGLLAIQMVWGLPKLDDSQAVIRALVDANYQKEADLTILQLFKVDEEFNRRICEEVISLIQNNNPSIVTDPKHNSYWSHPEGLITQFSLLNVSGILNDYSKDHNRSIKGKSFAHGDRYPNLGQFISLFPHAVNFRINILNAKSRFTQHQEDICFFSNEGHEPVVRARFHLPIFTNPEAIMLMEGKAYHFDPGIVYFFHNGCIHDGANMSETESRIHLIWDMILTQDTFERMFKRSIDLPLLEKIEDVELVEVADVGIDPEYKRTNRKMSYDEAVRARFCPVQ
jgi:hypothetical protein